MHTEGEEQPEVIQQLVVRKIYNQICSRPDSFCNYLEGAIPQWGADTKLIYRHYATLYFVFAVSHLESDLGILDLIQVFVEARVRRARLLPRRRARADAAPAGSTSASRTSASSTSSSTATASTTSSTRSSWPAWSSTRTSTTSSRPRAT